MTATSSLSIICEKCHTGAMARAVVPRSSGALRGIGYVLTTPSILVLVVALLMLVGAVGDGRSFREQDLQRWTNELRAIEGLPPASLR